jgi:hypothetical protein
MKRRLDIKSLGIDLAIALLSAASLFALITIGTQSPEGSYSGFPLVSALPISHCQTVPDAFNGCGFTYSVPLILADYFFWVAISFLVIYAVRQASVRRRKGTAPYGTDQPAQQSSPIR